MINKLDVLFSTLKLNPAQGVIIISASEFEVGGLDPGLGLLLLQVDNCRAAADAEQSLKAIYPDQYPVTVVGNDAQPGSLKVTTLSLEGLKDLPPGDFPICIYLKPYPEGRERTLAGIMTIVAHLRGDDGCPWDREQTHSSMRRNLIEEAYEVVEAIEADDMNKLCEELGDLLLQVVFHARLAEEKNNFIMADCLQAICTKMRRRHPHVFSSVSLDTAQEVLQHWDKIKAAEKKSNGVNDPSVLSVPRSLPALLKALKVQEQAARVGFDWPKLDGVWAKIGEELGELIAAIVAGQRQEQNNEMGDLFFAAVNLARWLKIEPESSLQQAIDRFSNRFKYLEKKIRQKGKQIEALSLGELDDIWQEAKEYQENKR